MQEQLDFVKTKLADALDRGQLDAFIKIENQFYSLFIKRSEQIEHYERCYAAIDPLVTRFGEMIASGLQQQQEPARERICYLLPSLDNDLAHIEFLFNILKMHSGLNAPEVFIAGYSATDGGVRSRLLARLRDEGRIQIVKIPFSAAGMLDFCRFFIRERFSLLIVYSIPMMLSAWVRALGADRVAWATTKFELSSFAGLRHRLSFAGPHCETLVIRDRTWRRSVAAISPADIPTYSVKDRPRTRLLSINREEKMLTPQFLGAVCDVLVAEPATHFSWTGREHNPEIVDCFARRGLAERAKFIGWVDPSRAIADHDIFVDVYGLSGMVATYAFCAGMPVQFFRASKSWLEIHESRIVAAAPSQAHVLSSSLASDPATYSVAVLELVRSASRYAERSAWQLRIGADYLSNEQAMYDGHIAAIRSILADTRAVIETAD